MYARVNGIDFSKPFDIKGFREIPTVLQAYIVRQRNGYVHLHLGIACKIKPRLAIRLRLVRR